MTGIATPNVIDEQVVHVVDGGAAGEAEHGNHDAMAVFAQEWDVGTTRQ